MFGSLAAAILNVTAVRQFDSVLPGGFAQPAAKHKLLVDMAALCLYRQYGKDATSIPLGPLGVSGTIMMTCWSDLPIGRVVRLHGVSLEAITLSLEPLPDLAPAIVFYYPKPPASLPEAITAFLDKLHQVAVNLFPAWLPGAENLDGPQGAGIAAVRALAAHRAVTIGAFGPFFTDLAEQSLRGTAPRMLQFAPEICAHELAKVIAASFNRSHAAVLVCPPIVLGATDAHLLGAACEWLAHNGNFGVWITGPLPSAFDRFQPVPVTFSFRLSTLEEQSYLLEPPERPAVEYPPIAGRPHPTSAAEQAFEAALAGCEWAAGRAWNQTFQVHALVNPIRVDLLWAYERCVVEVDGPEHRGVLKFEADRRRDVHLQLEGYAVLRFTSAQVMDDLAAVLSQLERFIQTRRTMIEDGG